MAVAEGEAVAQTDLTNVVNENTKKLNDNITATFEKVQFKNKIKKKHKEMLKY